MGRLDASTYARVKEAGFRWAPKQGFFVAPMWTPQREDLLIELAGEIGDEDTSLVDRAEERADRFHDYRDSRSRDAEAARKGVAAITEHIPFGQPILFGHHSERHARKDAERIESGMRKAVKMWDTAEYWKYRAAGALRHAKYKERADVRARRIKGLEADKRKNERTIAEARDALKLWQREGLTLEQAKAIANYSHVSCRFLLADFPRDPPASQYEGSMSLWSALDGGVINAAQAREIAIRAQSGTIAWASRWAAHHNNRINYERAMLGEQGGTVADKSGPEKGGAVRCWVGRGSWVYIQKVNKVTVSVLDNWGNGGPCFKRNIEFDKFTAIMTAGQVQQARDDGLLVELEDKSGFVLRAASPDNTKLEAAALRDEHAGGEAMAATDAQASASGVDAKDFEAIREQLNQGVKVVSVPQLFPTPAPLAARMVAIANVERGHTVLEPSAGTGSILRAIREATAGGAIQTAIEINGRLCDRLRIVEAGAMVHQRDFLQCNGDLGRFDRVLMNPPFANGQDIAHIQHALQMLKPGGRLVAICANGPRQNEQLRPLVEQHGGTWEVLPADTFKESGTGVNAAMLSLSV